MPLPSKRKGQSKKDFIAECMGNPESKKTFPDMKQRLAVCFSRWGEKKSKADYVVATRDDEYIYEKEDIPVE